MHDIKLWSGIKSVFAIRRKVSDKFGLKSDVVQYDTNHKNVIARLANSIYNANKRLEEKGEKTIIFLENIDDLMDERLSTVAAHNYLLEADMSRKKRKKV